MSFLKTLDTCIFGNGVVGVGVDLFVMFDDGMWGYLYQQQSDNVVVTCVCRLTLNSLTEESNNTTVELLCICMLVGKLESLKALGT